MGRLRLRSTSVGDTLLIHPRGRFDDRAAAFAAGLAADPRHTLVVVDLPAGALTTEWESVTRLLSPARLGSPRLVLGRETGDDIRTACRLIAGRLGREVLAADGDLIPTAAGGLFVPGDDGAAWLRFRPGREPEPAAQRFPKPHWEFSVPARARPAGLRTVVEPVPAGVWLRHTEGDAPAGRHRSAVEAEPTDPDDFLVVLGSPGAPPLPPADVAAFWDTVLDGARPAVRFVLYGALDTPAGRPPAQLLADTVHHPVVLYDSLPSTAPGGPAAPARWTGLPTGPTAAAPVAGMSQAAVAGVAVVADDDGETGGAGAQTEPEPEPEPESESEPGSESESGLGHDEAVHAVQAVPDGSPVLVPDAEPDPASSTQAAPLLGPTPASASAPVPAQRPAPPVAPRLRLESAAPESGIAGIDDIALPEPVGEPAGVPAVTVEPGAVRVQPVPRAAARALPPERGIAQERDWMRRTFSEQYNALAGSVSRVMSESPGLRGRSRSEAADVLTELVAVRLYLSGDTSRADAAVRAATAGPHVPLARCVTAGLRRLPSYRGPALLRTTLGEAERAWYREGRVMTEWAFCHARTSLYPGPRGGGATDLLIWSMTARRTSSLDPTVPDRVLFLPGTAFRVLRAGGSAVLMRELSASEATNDGPDSVTAKLDEIAVNGLENILHALERAGTDPAAESADPPGLIVTHRAVRTEGAVP
ncbi:hypothetical protein ABZ825_17860 [Streptomyces tauricus]|uniref:hypothetical protein n=1 Tax=Streptomyces tauricus TaxID=68274 RepID=UPI0033DB9885